MYCFKSDNKNTLSPAGCYTKPRFVKQWVRLISVALSCGPWDRDLQR